jgi:hypothetical protein
MDENKFKKLKKFLDTGKMTDRDGTKINFNKLDKRIKTIDLETAKSPSPSKHSKGGLKGNQKKLAAKAPPPNKIDEKDFAVLRKEKAKGRGMGLQDEKVQPGKVQKAILGKMIKGVGKGVGRIFGRKKSSTATPGAVTMSKSGKGFGGMLPQLLQKAIDDGVIKPASKGRMMKARKGKMASDRDRRQKELIEKQNPISEYDRKGKLKYTAAKMGKVMKAKRGKLGEAKDYKKYLKGLKKATSEVRGSKLNSPAYNITTYDQKSYEKAGGKGKAVFKDYKGLGIKNEDQYFKEKKKYSSMAEMRKAKGFKAGETPSEFNKRRMALAAGKKALKATKIGKIALGVGAAGVAAQQYLKSKMKKDKKMGGGMMQKPMGYRSGGHYDDKNKNVVKHIRVKKKMGGGMIAPSQRPGYSKGTMVKARGCKLGRTRPTKIT